MFELLQLITLTIIIHYLSCKFKVYFIHWHLDTISQSKLQWKHVVIIPLVGSLFLIFVFFYPSTAKYFIYASVFFSAVSCFCLILQPIFDYVPSLSSKIRICLSLLISLTIIFVYLLTQTRWSSNIIAIGVAVAIQSFLFVDKVHIPLVLLSIMFFYDIFWVFGSANLSLFDGKSVMVEAAKTATSLKLPLLIEFINGQFLIGLGDIILPGIFINYAYCIDLFYKTKYFITTLLGYCFGLVLTLFVLWNFKVGQPALLYLVPSMVIPFLIYAYYSKTIKTVFSLSLTSKFSETNSLPELSLPSDFSHESPVFSEQQLTIQLE
ncbi:signal peptide peptidase family protein [Entamoeba histolytica HM-1:IMSS-B]|uniref:Signal peptide peptidase family protein n=6 Tax=Entamoeba histolytica TaxID=5759 RepID=C4M1W4_ENTH1|nr:signal peptide peptidase family protein [Entamoeba histolytica HM-1:IMSS]EMD49760.1 signal peptide peptidase family protein [Entamoeba histolytica KU27]EMH76399.1 signal peptide peptidase family protein [Entamoeba histolytica HM-1:IMSS-B]EMS14241.1 signal peptide peptidase family protein [Entamoeba histolytica HM-3:IMSS]ENY63147.1 signal peptide peptidase family protein, putative [Entamoeba histolytica HM-1:IMSS-A]GAT95233.1 signal peptide peptidase family protein [Entamoeba histolytica]|eukprot:XP_657563.1 signal peptide peptidase family protein [Entamoeba histolytica HM-1:IMSS]